MDAPRYEVLVPADMAWRPSNQMQVDNTDLAAQLGASELGARYWRLAPGQASTRHRHRETHELYVVFSGTGRVRLGEDPPITLPRGAVVMVEPGVIRQLFNDTDEEVLWLILGAPTEPANTLVMSADDLAWAYPDGPRALPPEVRVQSAPASATSASGPPFE